MNTLRSENANSGRQSLLFKVGTLKTLREMQSKKWHSRSNVSGRQNDPVVKVRGISRSMSQMDQPYLTLQTIQEEKVSRGEKKRRKTSSSSLKSSASKQAQQSQQAPFKSPKERLNNLLKAHKQRSNRAPNFPLVRITPTQQPDNLTLCVQGTHLSQQSPLCEATNSKVDLARFQEHVINSRLPEPKNLSETKNQQSAGIRQLEDSEAYEEYLMEDQTVVKRQEEQLKRAQSLWAYHAKNTDSQSKRCLSSRSTKSRTKGKTPTGVSDSFGQAAEKTIQPKSMMKSFSQVATREDALELIREETQRRASPLRHSKLMPLIMAPPCPQVSKVHLKQRPMSTVPTYNKGRESIKDLRLVQTEKNSGKATPKPTHFMDSYRNEGCFTSRNKPSSKGVGALKSLPYSEHRKATVFGKTFYEHFPNMSDSKNHWQEKQGAMTLRMPASHLLSGKGSQRN